MSTVRRPYRSTLREEQARATRRAIVEAARDLFVDEGYTATTIDAVAARAGVSRKTVFTAVGGKAELLKLAWDWALVGDDEPVPMGERPEVQRMMRETDPRVLISLWATFVTTIAARVATLHAVLTVGADADPDVAALNEVSERNLRFGALGFVSSLAALGALRPGLEVGRAADIAVVLMDPMPCRRLVGDAGWTLEEYAAWVEQVAVAAFLGPGEPGP